MALANLVKELDTESFSVSLDWRQFEGLAELAFKSFGYKTLKNYRVRKPRIEIDLLAISDDISFAVDCKHWRRTVGHATMFSISEKQIDRCKKLVALEITRNLVPLILTLHDERLLVLENGVAIVPVQKISDFILNWHSENLRIIGMKNIRGS